MKKNDLKSDSEQKEYIETFFLDSGAHSLYNREIFNKKAQHSRHASKWAYYETDEFWKYVDDYAAFVKAHKEGIDYYANVDVIFNPELSWKALKYMEDKHKLSPVPVIHCGTDMSWVKRHLDEGYEFLGIGGLGQGVTRRAFLSWGNVLFTLLCPGPKRLPIVRTHGFAMTSWRLMRRYPWWSVDSASWIKMASFGNLLIPHKRRGVYTFDVEPHNVIVSMVDMAGKKDKHLLARSPSEQKIIREWLDEIEVPYGKTDSDGNMVEWGVCSHYGPRRIANLIAFKRMADSVPEYPWPFGGTMATRAKLFK